MIRIIINSNYASIRTPLSLSGYSHSNRLCRFKSTASIEDNRQIVNLQKEKISFSSKEQEPKFTQLQNTDLLKPPKIITKVEPKLRSDLFPSASLTPEDEAFAEEKFRASLKKLEKLRDAHNKSSQ